MRSREHGFHERLVNRECVAEPFPPVTRFRQPPNTPTGFLALVNLLQCQHEGNKMFLVEFQPVGYISFIASAATPHPLRCSLELEFHTKRESSFHHNCRSPVESPTWVVDSLATKFSSHKFAFSSLQCRVDEKEEGGGGGGE
uniref:Uncharacterized protein n=1 Tax=Mesocestoides corti TaxID=53468 RepID=A0A5K3FK56_MESCO